MEIDIIDCAGDSSFIGFADHPSFVFISNIANVISNLRRLLLDLDPAAEKPPCLLTVDAAISFPASISLVISTSYSSGSDFVAETNRFCCGIGAQIVSLGKRSGRYQIERIVRRCLGSGRCAEEVAGSTSGSW
jgi:hypothetical protein